jgi:hypothetical protein
VVFANLYNRKTPAGDADQLNNRMIPLFDEHGMPLNRVLTNRRTDLGRAECELYLTIDTFVDPKESTVKNRYCATG